MSVPNVAAAGLAAETAGAAAAVHNSTQAFNEPEIERLLALSAPTYFELVARSVAERGHEAVRMPLRPQSHGVAQPVRPRPLPRASVDRGDGGADRTSLGRYGRASRDHARVAVADVPDGRVSQRLRHPDVPWAVEAADPTSQAVPGPASPNGGTEPCKE
jgi:hypothetical protein